MPTRRTATLLTIMRPERGHGTEAQSLSRGSAGLRRYKSQSAILYWIRRRRRRWRESCAGRRQERTPVGPGESGRTPPRVDCHRLLLQVTLSPAAIVISWVRAEFVGGGSGAGNRPGRGHSPSCYSGYRFPTGSSACDLDVISEVRIRLPPPASLRTLGPPRDMKDFACRRAQSDAVRGSGVAARGAAAQPVDCGRCRLARR
jgi:hypothetical protein